MEHENENSNDDLGDLGLNQGGEPSLSDENQRNAQKPQNHSSATDDLKKQAVRYVPLTLDLIDEGRLLSLVNKDFQKMNSDLIALRKLYGLRLDGSKAVLTMKVTLICDPVDKGHFIIKSQSDVKMPTRPGTLTIADSGMDETDQPCLFVKTTGSSRTHPRQAQMFGDQGEALDDIGKKV